ncbi:MAG: hypothetical protein HYS98_04485 [Deltaproteobacteria bacterium]|nr:hypothetical protein [Deltaproteobacteria bacterium]
MKEKLETQKILRSNTLIHTIPCCVDVEYFSKARAHDDKSDVFTFAYCGSVGTYNLIDEMFDFLNVVQKKRAVQFLILTQNQNRAEQFLSLRTDLSPKSITILFTPHKNIASYLKTADAALVFRRDSACAIALRTLLKPTK